MRYRITMYFSCICWIFSATYAVDADDVQQKLQTARILLDQPTPDIEQLTALSDQLKAFVLNESDNTWRDSTCKTVALIARATSTDPQSHRWAIDLCTTDPLAPWTKYTLDYCWPVGGEAAHQLEVADKLLDMCGRSPDAPWVGDFKTALFRAYAAEEFWSPAAFLGMQLMRADFPLGAQDQLTLANCLLRANQEESAREVLFALSNNTAPNSPQALRASVELGLIEQVLGRDIQSKQEFQQAWNIWQKHKRKPGFSDPLVANAAARARWELLQFEFAALEKTLHVSLEWNAKEATRWCNELERNTNELLTIAPSYESAVALLTGKLHRLEGDALLRLGMFSSRPEDLLARDKLRAQALTAFNQAADILVFTARHEAKALPPLAPGHWSTQKRDFQTEAQQETYDLYVHVAEQLEGWAASLWQQTPLRSFGQNGYSPRFDAIVHEAFPVLQECVNYRKLALRFARQNPGIDGVENSVATLYQDMLKPVMELRKLCGSQWQTTSANAMQISRTLAATSNPDAVESMTEALSAQLAEATKLANESNTALATVFEQLFTAVPDKDSLSLLAEHKLALDREYAAMNRTVHESLEFATHSLDRRETRAASLRSKLFKYSSSAADVELSVLEEGHAWAQANGYLSSGGSLLYARLSERDPAKYPLRGGVWQAGRK